MMTHETAKAIVAHALRRAGGRNIDFDSLLREHERMVHLGDTARAEEVSRTIEDLAGHFVDGRFVGATQIAEAFRLVRR